MKEKIMKIVVENNEIIKRRLSESYFKKNYVEIYNMICNYYNKLNITFGEMLYLILNNMETPPVCKICGKGVRFKKISEGYSTYCSRVCIGADKDVQLKRENTSLNKNGFRYTLCSPENRKKLIQSNLNKYGVEYPQQLDCVKQKTKDTFLKKYGVEHHLKLESQIKKRDVTNLKNFGKINPMQNEEIKEKSKQTNLIKYGHTSPMKNADVLNKLKSTNLKKYGVEYTFLNEETKIKSKKTILERYGVTSYSKTDESKLRVKKTKKLRYDNENYNNVEKIKKTSQEKYGFDNPSKNEVVINKIKNTVNINFKKKYSSLLNIGIDDITLNDSDVIIKKYCAKHNSFKISKSLLYSRLIDHLHENVCTKCNPISKNVSIVENELKNFIESLNVEFFENYRLFNDKRNVDVYIPNHNIAIEFNGLYWHSELFKNKKYHLSKTEDCKKLGIQLLHVFEDEWIYKKNIVKSIIRSKLKLNVDKIYAKNCIIDEINDNTSVEFLNQNHIQGNVNSLIKIGLYHNNELVSIMCFEKARTGLGNKDNSNDFYNLSRFCSRINLSVVGGASKLLNYFIKNYSPKNIITYADRRYSNGGLYKNIGFDELLTNPPSYSYFDQNKGIRHHRFNYRKSRIIKLKWYDINKSVTENLIGQKIVKIYDCGTIKYQMIL